MTNETKGNLLFAVTDNDSLPMTRQGVVPVPFEPMTHFDYHPLNDVWGARMKSPLTKSGTKYFVPKSSSGIVPADGRGTNTVIVKSSDVSRECAKFMVKRNITPVKNAIGVTMYPLEDLLDFVDDYILRIKELASADKLPTEEGEDNVEHSN